MARARVCVGARFRPQGRHPSYGLDCVGLALWAWGLPAEAVARDYRLRGATRDVLEGELARFGTRVPAGRAGDLVLAQAGPGQPHLIVLTNEGFVHADAGAGRVEARTGPPPWPVLSIWRRN